MELRQALETNDLAEIQAKTEALNEAAQPLAEAMYASAQAEQAGPAGSDKGGNGSTVADDEVVEDADFEVIEEDEAAKTT
jgi:molecular chaperone DnaK